jgi:hypothetical protein
MQYVPEVLQFHHFPVSSAYVFIRIRVICFVVSKFYEKVEFQNIFHVATWLLMKRINLTRQIILIDIHILVSYVPVSPLYLSFVYCCIISESFAMGKLHKDIAKHMVQCAETEEMSEEQLIKVSSWQSLYEEI